MDCRRDARARIKTARLGTMSGRAALPLPPRHEPRPRGRGAVRRQARLRSRRTARANRRGAQVVRAGRLLGGARRARLQAAADRARGGAVNVVVQPGQWPVPRVDHLGLVLDDEEFDAALERARAASSASRSTAAAGRSYRRTRATGSSSIRRATGSTSCSSRTTSCVSTELHLKAEDPAAKAEALAEILDAERRANDVTIGDTVVRFVRGGPQGRPELTANCSLGQSGPVRTWLDGHGSAEASRLHAPGHRLRTRPSNRTWTAGAR